jgi:hypothetical protein
MAKMGVLALLVHKEKLVLRDLQDFKGTKA